MPIARTDDNTSLAYRVSGTGARNLIFMHGWAGSARYFDETIAQLDGSAVRAIALDMRGHGDSDKPGTAWTLDRLAHDVLTVADDAGGPKRSSWPGTA
jgi:pimeloyl-ACP methyl ester carboxylesterase